MKQLTNDNAANRTSYVGFVYNTGEKTYKNQILDQMPKEWSQLHRSGAIHIHDLDAYDLTYNCLTFDLINKFPYHEFSNLDEIGKIVRLFSFLKNLFTKLGNEQSGGMAFANFDNEMATVLNNLNVDYKKHQELIASCMREFIIWCNDDHSRMGQTSYYITLNLGLANNPCARFIAQQVITQFMQAGDLIYKPNIVFKVVKGINNNPKDPNYGLFLLALKSTARKMIPTYLLCDCKGDKWVDPNKLSIMGCRTRVAKDLFGQIGSIGRGNIGNISINLPRLALKINQENANLSFLEKMQLLQTKWLEVATIVKDILLDKYAKVCKHQTDEFPTNSQYHLWCEEFKNNNLVNIFKHGTLSIGFIGLSETMEILSGKKFWLDNNVYKNALAFVKYMHEYCDELTAKYQLNFSLLATAGELISGRFIEKDIELYHPTQDLFKKGYYTNSFHIDVDSLLPGYQKIALEGPFHELCTGGCITYLELGEAPLANIEALEEYVNLAINANVHYLGLNFPKDVCNECKASGVFDKCLNCNSTNITRIRRVSGYLEILDGFTNGKMNEERNRKKN